MDVVRPWILMVLVPWVPSAALHPTRHKTRLAFNADLPTHLRPTLLLTDPTLRESIPAWPWVATTSTTTTKATTSRARTVTMIHMAQANSLSSEMSQPDGTQGLRTPRSSPNKGTLVSPRTFKHAITFALYIPPILDI